MNFWFRLACMGLLMSLPAISQTSQTKVTWYGHSAFRIETPAGHVLWIDPWLSNPLDPAAQGGADPMKVVDKGDYILLTYGHFDHVGETVKIANKTHARLLAPFDLAEAMVKVAKFPADQTGFDTMGNPGGEITLADGEVKIAFVQAIHSSNLEVPDGDKTGTPAVSGGLAVGYVIRIKNGPTIYDSGDTAYFTDIKLIGAKFHPDLAILNIGGHFGMEVPDALQAAKDVGAKLTIPQHYKSFPILTQSPDEFLAGLRKMNLIGRAPQAGETITFDGKQSR
jgi:L-ascorbate metabolism protein UlaG (beta-lactamase superfamily)